MAKIRNLSVRKTIILYMVISLICCFFLSAVIAEIASRTQERIWMNYIDKEKLIEAQSKNPEQKVYTTEIARPSRSVMSRVDHQISEICDFLQTYIILILSITGSCVAVFFFYRHKLKVPIAELELASQNIARDNLDFQVTYETQDEMGRLCQEFERMRKQLIENNQKLWRTIEDEKALRAAVAHDIRSPLSVLMGYQEMLIDYLPNGTIDTNRAVEMLTESMKQLERMDVFVETMRKMNSLEQRELLIGQIKAEQLERDIQAEVDILGMDNEKHIILSAAKTTDVFCGDLEVIMEVTENLLSNALRYANSQVEVDISVTYSELSIRVKDDGVGFREEAEKITEAFHQQNAKDSLKHAGMGMYISRLYCEKHGGILILKNEELGGAAVTAVFHRIV